MSIDKASGVVTEMQQNAKIIDDLMGGTKAMRAAREIYLPCWPLEDEKTYSARLAVSTLFPALRETVGQMTGRVFAERLNEAEIDKAVAAFTDNVDMIGNNLDIFASKVFSTGLQHGVAYVVVDYLKSDTAVTQADVQAEGLRPFATILSVHDVLGWRTENLRGTEKLVNFRYKRKVVEYTDEFTEEEIEEIVLLTQQAHTIYRKDEGGKFVEFASHLLSVNGKQLSDVPVLAFYTNKTGFFTASPPLEDLAFLNVKHWQSQSDQDNILHTARVPLLARIGADDSAMDDDEDEVQISGSTIDVPIGGDVKYIEHSGAAIQSGRDSLADLETQMQAAGAKLITRSVIAMTDKQAESETDKEISLLRLYANNLQDALGNMFDMFAMWLGKESGGSIQIIGNIDTQADQDAELSKLIEMYKAGGVISAQTMYQEAQKRGYLSDDDTWEVEQARIEAQAGVGMKFNDDKLPMA